ncbi:hypothetical protein HPB51_010122 [Rhipicephalus microplus]|uniref:Hcy-binding domain-containing protein n=1 Tax=Rhipicephalus microplus TaxID=6941 RepID=A0A9J6F0Q5_RHIMP|nr:hypothetical protein HPB51_010122 [Rhipicephalus microplus]
MRSSKTLNLCSFISTISGWYVIAELSARADQLKLLKVKASANSSEALRSLRLVEAAEAFTRYSTGGGLLERLDKSVVIGDGGFVFALEKRGYVKAGPWTPEAAVEHPEAVRQLHREFLRAGSDVMQAFTFYASDDKLINRGNLAGKNLTVRASRSTGPAFVKHL